MIKWILSIVLMLSFMGAAFAASQDAAVKFMAAVQAKAQLEQGKNKTGINKASEKSSPTSTFQNGFLFAAYLIFISAGFYYALIWIQEGRGPRKNIVFPLFKPPAGYSPGAIRFITHKGYDNKAFSAALVSMAVKGFLRISESSGGNFSLQRKKEADFENLSKGEKAIASQLFLYGDTLNLSNDNRHLMLNAIESFKESLKEEFQTIYFKTNSIYLLPGLGLSFLGLAALILGNANPSMAFMVILWLGFTLVLGYPALIKTIQVVKKVITFKKGRLAALQQNYSYIFRVLVLTILFYVIIQLVLSWSSLTVSFLYLSGVVILGNIIFIDLMKVHTLKGRRLVNQVEGFKQFLLKVEQPRINQQKTPSKTTDLFERYLPFAIALDVETAWGHQFEAVVKSATMPEAEKRYQPAWYSGMGFTDFSIADFSLFMGTDFSDALSSMLGGLDLGSHVGSADVGGGMDGGG